MKIHILEAGFGKRHPIKRLKEHVFRPYWFPLDNAAAELRDLGLHCTFWSTVSDGLFDCDILILSCRTVDALCAASSSRFRSRAELCEFGASKTCKLVWYDSRDSAGTCQFDVIPHVSLYLKRQLYRDRSMYLKPLFAGRVYSDYYHTNYDVGEETDPLRKEHPSLPEEVASDLDQTAKMRVAWGGGAEFHATRMTGGPAMPGYLLRQSLHRYLRDVAAVPQTASPFSPREIDVCALFDHKRYNVKAVGYQRRIGLERVKALETARKVTGRVPQADFYRTLANSAVTVSVFGWGEVCYREYEAAYCGSSVLMADMSGIETYPDFYQAGRYYTPFAWDFSDFEERFHELMADPDRRIGIAKNAQDLCLAQWTRDGRESFAKHFARCLDIPD